MPPTGSATPSPAGLTNPTSIVTQADPSQVADAAAAVDRVVSTRPLGTTEGTSRIEVIFDAQAGSDESEEATKALRGALADFETTYGIGNEAEAIDQAEGAQRDQARHAADPRPGGRGAAPTPALRRRQRDPRRRRGHHVSPPAWAPRG